ncbi:MAG: hypothetical protein K5764_08235 [Prevotella sp.]|nr:hypothetical protein [Prevotella sp.]
MSKAFMYLLLALGITIGVIFVGGALVGFVIGFIVVYNGNDSATLASHDYYVSLMLIVLGVLWFAVVHWVFLRNRYASYSLGVMPKGSVWLVSLMAFLGYMAIEAMMLLFYHLPAAGQQLKILHEEPLAVYIVFSVLMEPVTAVVLYGAALRELLAWRHRPEQIIPVFAGVGALLSALLFYAVDMPQMAVLIFCSMLFSGWIFERTRSIVPIVVGAILADLLFWLVVDWNPSSWLFLPAMLLLLIAGYGLFRATEGFKPID